MKSSNKRKLESTYYSFFDSNSDEKNSDREFSDSSQDQKPANLNSNFNKNREVKLSYSITSVNNNATITEFKDEEINKKFTKLNRKKIKQRKIENHDLNLKPIPKSLLLRSNLYKSIDQVKFPNRIKEYLNKDPIYNIYNFTPQNIANIISKAKNDLNNKTLEKLTIKNKFYYTFILSKLFNLVINQFSKLILTTSFKIRQDLNEVSVYSKNWTYFTYVIEIKVNDIQDLCGLLNKLQKDNIKIYFLSIVNQSNLSLNEELSKVMICGSFFGSCYRLKILLSSIKKEKMNLNEYTVCPPFSIKLLKNLNDIREGKEIYWKFKRYVLVDQIENFIDKSFTLFWVKAELLQFLTANSIVSNSFLKTIPSMVEMFYFLVELKINFIKNVCNTD